VIAENFIFLKHMRKLRLVLFPFGFLYGVITAIRNFLFDTGIKEVFIIPGKSICVGNLSVGGTGKTPHIAYLANLLQDNFKVQILSRGYGRKTKGYFLLDENSTSKTVGDEPLFYYQNFKKASVAVCESRKEGIQKLQAWEKSDVILLDDAFQHRAVKAGLNILLTDYNSPYYKDLMLPAGDLREWQAGRKRADMVLVTKSPTLISQAEKDLMISKLKFDAKNVFFTHIIYADLKSFGKATIWKKNEFKKILLVTGIANPEPLLRHLSQDHHVELISFADHHDFTLEDIQKIHKKFDTFVDENKAIVTTEKDFVRLNDAIFATEIARYPWFYQQISVKIDREQTFNTKINSYVREI
jgi:tetraacyldisaccharide 4'-kinase